MLENYHYLYVEDDAMSRDVMELIMEMIVVTDKYTIFDSSENFEARLAELPDIPDLIMLDIRIKPIDGFAMLGIIRKQDALKNTPVIALTASVMNAQVKQLRQAGFDGAIGKPLNVEILPTLLERILMGEAVWAIN